MNIQNAISAIKKKIVSPHIYAIELVCGTLAHLFICAAYSLEEAIAIAHVQLKTRQMGLVDQSVPISLGKYLSRDIKEIIAETTNLANTIDELSDKNRLMKKIIDTRDVELFHENISVFTDAEKMLLDEKLTHKKK